MRSSGIYDTQHQSRSFYLFIFVETIALTFWLSLDKPWSQACCLLLAPVLAVMFVAQRVQLLIELVSSFVSDSCSRAFRDEKKST